MDIRGYEFYKTSGLPVSGAAVDVWDAVDGTPGGSPLFSTTTTANGRWEFTSLTDTPKDVRVTFTGSIRWYKGLAKDTVTRFLVGTGGLLVLGNMGLGLAALPAANTMLGIGGTITTSVSTSQAAVNITTTLTAQANGDTLIGLIAQPTFNDNAHTGVVHVALQANGPTNLAGLTTITTGGLVVSAGGLTSKGTSNALQTSGGLNAGVTDDNQNVVVGHGSLANGATDGFLYIPTGGGSPTGVPTTKSGYHALRYDDATGKLMIYNGAAWVGVALA